MKTNPFFLFCRLVVLAVLPFTLSAQTASDFCGEQLMSAWNRIDISRLVESESITRMEFTYSYLHSENTDPVVQNVQAAAGGGQSRYMGSEEWVLSDANSTFTWFPYRFVMYRTTPRPEDRKLIRELSPSVFEHGIVSICEYIPFAGNDTLAWKRMVFTPDWEEKSRSGIRSVEFILNPWDDGLVKLRVEYEPNQILKWAQYEFSYITQDSESGVSLAPPEEVMLDGNGKVRPEFKGAQLMDYRKNK